MAASLFPFLLYSLGFLLGSTLWITRWKARIVFLHLESFRPPFPFQSRLRREVLLFQWDFNLSLDLLRLVLGIYEKPISIRPRDVARLHHLRNNPALFLTAHFHHWEALSAWLRRNQVPVVGAARPLHHPLARRLLLLLRKRLGVRVVEENVLPFALRHLRAGKCFGLLWDQFSPQSRHWSPLFGLPAAMNPLPEILVRRCQAKVWVGFLLPDGMFRLIPLHTSDFFGGSPETLSRRYHRLLEFIIRRHPTYWYGLCHARFKGVLPYRPQVRSASVPVSGHHPLELVSRETSS